MYRASRSKEEGVLVPARHSSNRNPAWKPPPPEVYLLQQRYYSTCGVKRRLEE